MDVIVTLLAALAALCLGVLLGLHLASRRQADLQRQVDAVATSAVHRTAESVREVGRSRDEATAALLRPVSDALGRLDTRLSSLEASEASWQAQLKQQVETVQASGLELRRETTSLAEALRRPHVRGNWGEMQLKRALELAGVTERCVFHEQVSLEGDDGRLRPDIVVSLPGDKSLVIDAKVALDAFLTGTAATSADARDEAFARHASQVRAHVDQLSAKAYWKQFDDTPEYVVMFMPGEAIFAEAISADPSLIDTAAAKRVVLATPTTLIAMLKTIAYAWAQESVTENAREVHRLSTVLYDRLATMGSHLDKLGGSLAGAVSAYNKTIGSLETRVLPSARKLHDLNVGDEQVATPRTLDDTPRPMTSPELLTDEARSA